MVIQVRENLQTAVGFSGMGIVKFNQQDCDREINARP